MSRPQLFSSVEQVKSACLSPEQAQNARLGAQDCLVLAPVTNSTGSFWVSSPNASWIPEVPLLRSRSDLTFFKDGMMGPFEEMKWPQAFHASHPHALAAPIEDMSKSWRLFGDAITLKIPWLNPSDADFVNPEAQMAQLSAGTMTKVRKEVASLLSLIMDADDRYFPLDDGISEKVRSFSLTTDEY